MKESKHEIEFTKTTVKLSGIFAWSFYLTLFGAFLEGLHLLFVDLVWLWNYLLNL